MEGILIKYKWCVMTEKRTHCNVCGSKIQDGDCSCGYWTEPGEDHKNKELCDHLEAAILLFNKLGQGIFSGDHHSGTCFILFKGNKNDCEAVVDEMERINRVKRLYD